MNKSQFLLSLLFGFLGAMLFSLVRESIVPLAFANRQQVVQATAFNLVDEQGKLRAQIAFAKEGAAPGLWLLDEKGVARGVFGLYGDGTSYFGLQDARGQMIELMRSFGPKESPLLIFKHDGQDMMITGLNPSQEPVPFLMSYESGRKKKIHFGNYEGP